MSTVFFVQKPKLQRGFNAANMEEFGEIVSLLDTNASPSLNPGRSIQEIRKRLLSWTPEDYLVAYGGDPLGVLMTGLVHAELYAGQALRWLRWDRARNTHGVRLFSEGEYQPMRFGLNSIGEME